MIKLKWEIIWTGGLLYLSGLPHLHGVPHLHVNRPWAVIANPDIYKKLAVKQYVNRLHLVSIIPINWSLLSDISSFSSSSCLILLLSSVLSEAPCDFSCSCLVEKKRENDWYKCMRAASLRSRRLEVVSERENWRARGRHACLLLERPFFLVPTTSKRLLRRLASCLLSLIHLAHLKTTMEPINKY